ncbi:hypothetical protein V8G54_028044 [Vigna mungo]|uniref:Integrase catalytic domain-containing protein n=1 Tax=Vigna mungo TaxID=3915 RepID=A0AAQ3RKJ2_VIGMU
MKHKSDVPIIFPIFKSLVENKLNFKINTLYSDNGGEFIKLRKFLHTNGISHLIIPPHTPEHNGLAKHKHRHLTETAKCLLHHASLPLSFWCHVFQTAAYLINRMPTPGLHTETPFQVLFQCLPNYHKLRTFGCLCFPWLVPYTTSKLLPKSQSRVFLGYSTTQSAYICYNPSSQKEYTSRHVQFVETVFPYSSPQIPTSCQPPSSHNPNLLLSLLHEHHEPTRPLSPSPPSPVAILSSNPPSNTITAIPTEIVPSLNPNIAPDLSMGSLVPPTAVEALPVDPPFPSHPMVTSSKNGIYKPKQVHLASKFPLADSTEPSCVTRALKNQEWKSAMSEEFNALLDNGTWSLVPREPSFNVVGNKWVFRLKRNTDGSIARYKARLVAKGFHQRLGLDYSDTFSLVVKPQTIKLVLCIALSHGWSLRQMDVNNAFLHGTISEDLYMSQPLGFLHKSLYGLKQAPRAWYNPLRNFLISYGFTNSRSDTSLFIYHGADIVAYFLVYVDDLLLIGNNMVILSAFQRDLAAQFALKDLGTPHHFLGVEILPVSTGIFLTQHHYIRDLLQSTAMTDAKPVSTPMSTSCDLSANSDASTCNALEYRRIVGSLQYLSLTRPDVSFSVNKLSQYMAAPTESHTQVAKSVLRYLKGTIDHGLQLRRDSNLSLTAFCDADWAGDIVDRRSTAAYIIYYGSNAISWSCKKQPPVAKSSTEADDRTIGTTWHIRPTTKPTLTFRNLILANQRHIVSFAPHTPFLFRFTSSPLLPRPTTNHSSIDLHRKSPQRTLTFHFADLLRRSSLSARGSLRFRSSAASIVRFVSRFEPVFSAHRRSASESSSSCGIQSKVRVASA